nr:serine hydrolase [Allomuricauda sp.]
MKIKYLLLMSALVCSIFAVKAQDNSASEQLDQLFSYCYENGIFNGTIHITKGGKTLLNKAYGFADIEKKQKLKTSSSFYLASLSKHFTAFSIALLEDDGKLKYDAAVRQYLPDFPYSNITLSHLLHHTSGIPEYQKMLNQQKEKLDARFEKTGQKVTNDELARIMSKMQLPLDFEPGTNFEYSNSGYMYLALIVEKVSGNSFADFLEKRIFHPLQMTSSGLIGDDNADNVVSAYKTNLYGKKEVNSIPNFFGIYGDGGIYSSVDDLAKWDKALRNHTLLNKEKSETLYETPLVNEKESPYGMGWFVRELPFNGARAVTHSGIFVGYTNSMFRELANKTTSIVLSNNSHSSNSEINRALVRILYGMPFEFPKITASKTLSKILLTEGIQKAVVFYEAQKSNDKYDFSEGDLNRLGYDLLERYKKDEAIAIFKINVKAHPESSNVYDSLGEAYLKSGNNEMAFKYYRIAFEKDPENLNAKKIIERLSQSKND